MNFLNKKKFFYTLLFSIVLFYSGSWTTLYADDLESHNLNINKIMQSITSGNNDDIQTAIDGIKELRALEEAKALPCLIEALENGGHFSIQQHAALALSQLGKSGIEALSNALESGSPAVKQLTLRVLAHKGISTDIISSKIVKLLRDSDIQVRVEAAKAAGKFKLTDAIPELVRLYHGVWGDDAISAWQALRNLDVDTFSAISEATYGLSLDEAFKKQNFKTADEFLAYYNPYRVGDFRTDIERQDHIASRMFNALKDNISHFFKLNPTPQQVRELLEKPLLFQTDFLLEGDNRHLIPEIQRDIISKSMAVTETTRDWLTIITFKPVAHETFIRVAQEMAYQEFDTFLAYRWAPSKDALKELVQSHIGEHPKFTVFKAFLYELGLYQEHTPSFYVFSGSDKRRFYFLDFLTNNPNRRLVRWWANADGSYQEIDNHDLIVLNHRKLDKELALKYCESIGGITWLNLSFINVGGYENLKAEYNIEAWRKKWEKIVEAKKRQRILKNGGLNEIGGTYNLQGITRVLIAEEISNLYFSLAETPERIVEFNKQLIQNPIGFIAGYEGFVLTEKAAQNALGFQDARALDVSFLSRWPRVQKFVTGLKQQVPMAVAMTVMESVRKIMENKEVLSHLDSAALMEQELFYVEVNNAILQSLILYANSTCDVLMDPDTYIEGLRNTGQFVAAGSVAHYGKMALRAGRLYCNGAKARAAIEAAAGAETGGAGFLVATGELAATFIIEEYLDRAVSSLISWWQERNLRQKLEQARGNFKILIEEPFAGDEQLKVAYQEMQVAQEAYEAYFTRDLKMAILQGEMEVENIKQKYDIKINAIQHKNSTRTYGEYQVHAYSWGGGASFTRQGEIEERYQKTNTGWMVLQKPIFEGLGSGPAYGYGGSVSTPTKAIQMTDPEFEAYLQKRTQEETNLQDIAIQDVQRRTDQRSLEIAQRIYGTESDDSSTTTILSLRREQIKFLEALRPL